MTRYLLLAEGSSGDPLYGKTTRGVLRYRREDVVVILDSTRAGETEDGAPIVGSVGEAAELGPTTALVGVVTQGGYFPPAWMELLRDCVDHGLDIENGLHVFLGDDPTLSALASERGVELRDLRRPPADLSTATGEEPRGRRDDRPHGRFRLRDREDDGLVRARSRGATARSALGVRPDRPDRDGDRGLGNGDRRRRGRLPRGRRGAARARGARPRRRAALGRGPGLARPSGLLRRDARALSRKRAASARALSRGRPDAHRGRRRRPRPIPPLRRLVELHERLALPARPARVAAIALNTRALGDDEARAAIAAAEEETGLSADDPVRFGASKLVDAVLSARP